MENKYLFVCYANKNRSIIGERVFKEMLSGRGFRVGGFYDSGDFDFYVGSAGINPEEETKCFSLAMVEGIGTVFVADERIQRFLKRDYNFEDESRTVNLNIPDVYDITIDKQRRVLEEYMRLRLVHYLPRR
jgi:predicted protein tyrosine phosphatase